MMKVEYLGSNFDDFLVEEGLLAEGEVVAIKRVIAYQIAELMKEKKLTKRAMAEWMETSRAALERLLDPANESVTLQTLERAALALGKRLKIEFV
jgi:DNA-binding Xre family transcriptional regulator